MSSDRNMRAELLAQKVVDLLKIDPTKLSDSKWSRLCVLLGAEELNPNARHYRAKRLRQQQQEETEP